MYKKILCFDFDGVIHSYTSGWKGIDIIPDPPTPGIKEAINKLREHYTIIVFSSRCAAADGIFAINNWLDKHNIIVDDVVAHKPPAWLTIDDRCYCFKGDIDDMLDKIDNFKSYLKKGTM